MKEFRIDPPIHIRAGPDRALHSVAEAVEFLRQWAGRRSGPDWGEVLTLLEVIQATEQVAGAIAALVTLLETEDLLVRDAERSMSEAPFPPRTGFEAMTATSEIASRNLSEQSPHNGGFQ